MANENGWGDASANNEIGWGQASNNEIGWADVYSKSEFGATDIIGTVAPKTDADAQAFFTASGITDSTKQKAINTLVTDLKTYSLWDKMKALYPFCGDNNSQNAWNLKNTTQYNITWYGGVTSSSNGISGNGTNGYGNTGLNDANVLDINNKHIAMYQRNILENPTGSSMGIGNSNRFYLNYSNQNYSTLGMSQSAFTAQSPQNGMFIMSKTANGSFKYYQNSLSAVTKTGTNSSQNLNYFLLACNTVSNPFDYTSANLAFVSIGDGLTHTEVGDFRTIVEAFQTNLKRNV